MSYFGSPMSNSYNNHEYDFQDDKLEEELENDFPDDHHEGSDEDTEDASETDTGLNSNCFYSFNCVCLLLSTPDCPFFSSLEIGVF